MSHFNNPIRSKTLKSQTQILKKLSKFSSGTTVINETELDTLVQTRLHELLADLKKQADEKRKEMKEHKLTKILEHLEENTTITNRQIRTITDVSEMTAVYYLRELIEREKIERMNKGRNVAYKLK